MNSPALFMQASGDGHPLVLLHGWGMNSSIFTPLVAQLPQYQCLQVDLPGFGDSAPLDGGFDAWVDQLAQHLPEQAMVLGWSLGGLLATRLAQRYPTKVAALITVASSPYFLATAEWPGIPAKVLQQFTQQLQQDLPKTIERFLALQAMGSDTARDDIRRIRELVLAKPQPDATALADGLAMLRDIDLREDAATLQLPWLRLWGKLDGLVPHRVITQMPTADNITDAIFAKASHAPFISHPHEVVTEIQRWSTATGLI
ncbi:pimeloyl-ACP methyl ester esterase BioH [Shewanella sp.]|uniref:pimeloyl-ACP methyl ester esterase BioH n=1 Tax=Shewanella sp. TaxID=50422 RepID=UPI003A9849E2